MSGTSARVTIVGSGAIGTTLAYSLVMRRAGIELLLCNRDERKSWAKAFDISHCASELGDRSIRSVTVDESAGSDVIVMTAGALPREDGTRSDVIRDNVAIYRSLVPALAERSPNAVIVAITNPVDAMAYATSRLSGFPRGRVIGSGTELDGMRLRSFVADAFGLDQEGLTIDIVGEHGDSMVPLWSRSLYRGRPLAAHLSESGADFGCPVREELLRRTRRAGWDIRLAGEHSCFGIAFSAARIVESIIGGSAQPRSVSAPLLGELGLNGAWVSLPTRLGRAGVESRQAPTMSDAELDALRASAAVVRSQMEEVDRILSSGER
ncbi:MAG TPA: hypothetical protein VHE79_14345 [Spirochaetia bacterium]